MSVEKMDQGQDTALALLDMLTELGIRYVLGNGGTDFPPIIEALARGAVEGRNLPTAIAVPHECCAVSMAHGYYMLTGEPLAVMLHTTVGTANAAGSIMNAARANVPIIVIAGRSPINETGRFASRDQPIHWSQESFDQASMIREYVKWDYELRNFEQLSSVIGRAFRIAMTEPRGPVYITLPREVLAERRAGDFRPGSPKIVTPSVQSPDLKQIGEAAGLLANAKSPLILTRMVGADPQAVKPLVRVSEAFAIPVVDSLLPPYLNFPWDHPLHLGQDPGPFLPTADVVLVVDNDVPWSPFRHRHDPSATFIHIGMDPLWSRYPIWDFPVHLAIRSNSRLALEALAQRLEAMAFDDARKLRIARRYEEVATTHRRQQTERERQCAPEAQGKDVTLPWLAACLRKYVGPDVVFVNEYDLSVPHLGPSIPGSIFGITPAGSLGWGFGAALGAKLAKPEKMIVCVVGDGSYIFSVPTACHLVAASNKLPVLVVVCNNGGWAANEWATRSVYPDGFAARTSNFPLCYFGARPSYDLVAQAFGAHGETVREARELPASLDRAVEMVLGGRQVLLNVEISGMAFASPKATKEEAS